MRTVFSIVALLGAVVLVSACKQTVSFSEEVFPILEKNCLSCHAKGRPGHAASGFSMETYDDFMRGTKYGPVVVPGSGFSSTLAILIEHRADPSINMPYEQRPLAEREIELIKTWIDQGAQHN